MINIIETQFTAMILTQRGKSEELQPAIDTFCDHCGAIYDLADCYTSVYGNVLCPDCNAEGFGKNNSLPGIKINNRYEAISIDHHTNSFYIKQDEWYQKFVSLIMINKIQKLLKINLLAFFRRKQSLLK